MTQPTYYTPDGVPVFVDPPQHSGETMPDRRIEVYKCVDCYGVGRRHLSEMAGDGPGQSVPCMTCSGKKQTARSFTGKVSVPCAVPERSGHGWITGTADMDSIEGQAFREGGE